MFTDNYDIAKSESADSESVISHECDEFQGIDANSQMEIASREASPMEEDVVPRKEIIVEDVPVRRTKSFENCAPFGAIVFQALASGSNQLNISLDRLI